MRLKIASFVIVFMLISDCLYFSSKYFEENFLIATSDIFCESEYIAIYLRHV